MVTAALLTIFALGATPNAAHRQVPTQLVELPAAMRSGDATMCVQVTATHFAAESLVPEAQWLVFEWAATGHVATHPISRFSTAVLPMPQGSTEGMTLRIARFEGSLMMSAPVSFDMLGRGSQLIFDTGRTGGRINAWISSHGGKALTRVRPAAQTKANAEPEAELHVPVPLPAENKKRSKQRPLKRKKLPLI